MYIRVRGEPALPEPSTHPRPPWRWIPVALLVAAAVALALVLRSDGRHEYRIVFADAGQLVTGNLVRIGGTGAGEVTSIELTGDNRAEVTVAVDGDYAPLHDGTTATVRTQSLSGVANRYVDLDPGSGLRPALDDGARIDTDRTTAIVEVDELFNTLDPPTRKGLARMIRGFADWYEGREREANVSAREFPRALDQLDRLAAELTRDSGSFEDFVVQTGDAMSALDDRRAQLTSSISSARATARALGSDAASLETALQRLPGALREGGETLAELRPAIGDLRRLVDVTGPATRRLTPFLRELRPVLERATPTFGRLRAMFDRPGANDDLVDAMRDLPALDRTSAKAFPNARRALRDSTPVFGFVRPYIPDTVAWLRSFGGAMAPYDARGHYTRTLPVFDAYEFSDDDDDGGGRFTPKPPDKRGVSAALQGGNLRRCPGAAARAPADGSAPFVDDGPLANPDCDPRQRPGGPR